MTLIRSVLSQLTTFSTRSDVLVWYVTLSAVGSSLGSEASGRIIHFLQDQGRTAVEAYHVLFWIFAGTGVINIILVMALSDACELSGGKLYNRIPQHDATEDASQMRPRKKEAMSWLVDSLTQISAPTRSVMFKLWFLLSVDSLADGMVPYSLTNYYLDEKFGPSKSTLGDVTSVAYFLAAIGAAFAGPLARRVGLVNTMVFTHVPSSAGVLVFPFPPFFWMAVVLLLIRAGLNNMDQAPRSAFIAAIVKPEERTAVMGITSTLRTLSAMLGPSVTGVLAAGDRFWIAFVLAGICRLAYDFGLYALFVNMVPEEREISHMMANQARQSEQGDAVEMRAMSASEDESSGAGSVRGSPAKTGLQLPVSTARSRSRSPHNRTQDE